VRGTLEVRIAGVGQQQLGGKTGRSAGECPFDGTTGGGLGPCHLHGSVHPGVELLALGVREQLSGPLPHDRPLLGSVSLRSGARTTNQSAAAVPAASTVPSMSMSARPWMSSSRSMGSTTA
jgi:hypothetical protein